jgi:hypothetical protein
MAPNALRAECLIFMVVTPPAPWTIDGAAISARLNTNATDRAAQVQAERGPSFFCQSPKGPGLIHYEGQNRTPITIITTGVRMMSASWSMKDSG